eukprot:c21830_g1_i1 orf=173-2959(+)
MHLLHRSGKRLLLNKSNNVHFTDLTKLPLRALHRLCQLEGEHAQNNIVNKSTQRFSVFVEDLIHQPSLRNQHRGFRLINVYPGVSHSKHMHMYVYEAMKCKAEGLEHDPLELAGGATSSKSVVRVDDCAFTDVDDGVLASQKTFTKRSDLVIDEVGTTSHEKHKKEKCTNEGVVELVVAETQTIFHRDNNRGKQIDSDTLELAEINFLTEEDKCKRFDGSTVEPAILDHEASCKDMENKKQLVSSMSEGAFIADGTTEYLCKAEQGRIVHDSALESFVSNAKIERMEKGGFKAAVNNTSTGLQRDDEGMLMVKDTSELCLNDIRTSPDKMREEGKCSDLTGFLQGDVASEKAELSMMKHVPLSLPSERKYFAVQKKRKKNRKKKKKKSWNIDSQLGPEDLKQLSLSTHPFGTAEAGLAFCDEKPETCGRSLKYIHAYPNYNMVLSKIISPVIQQESSGYVDSSVGSSDAMSGDGLKLEAKEVTVADGRQVNQGITNEFVKNKQNLFVCEDSSKSSLDQNKPGTVSIHSKSIEQYEEGVEDFIKKTNWEGEVIKRQHREKTTGKIWRQWEEGLPSAWKEEAYRSLLLTDKQQAHPDALSKNHIAPNDVIDKISTSPTNSSEKWLSSHTEMESHLHTGLDIIDTVEKEKEATKEAASYFCQIRGKMISYDHFKAGTSLDSTSEDWMATHVDTIENGVDRDQWNHACAPKVHYPLRNSRELYIILDLNGLLIKRWGENPSLPGVCKLNKKWVQVRPGCIEFLQKAFSFFRVGIWSTMTQKNTRGVCKLLEQQAHQSLPFFMLWSKDSCYQLRGVQRPDKAHVIADFKPLSHVWGYFRDLGFHNTVLVDDSPYKACMNNPYNCIFPDAFGGCTDDKYLNDVLWPYLERMRMSQNIQAYIANNPLGQRPIVVGHELYYHVRQVIDVFDYLSKP